MKKIWVLLMAVVLFISCASGALANSNPINGTWRMESGSAEVKSPSGSLLYAGHVPIETVHPSQTKIEMEEGAGGKFNLEIFENTIFAWRRTQGSNSYQPGNEFNNGIIGNL